MKQKINRQYMLKYFMVILYAFIFLFAFFTMEYSDGRINANIGYHLAKSILDGNFIEVFNANDFSYGVTIYFIYAIWSLPLALIHKILNIEVDIYTAMWQFCWYKLLLVLFLALCAWQFYKLIDKFSNKDIHAKQFTFLFLTSSIAFFPVLAITQCDVMSLFFMLLGINYLIDGKETKFAFAFGIATTMKYLAFFIFIPIILLAYKDIKKWIKIGVIEGIVIGTSFFIQSLSNKVSEVVEQEDYYVNVHVEAMRENANVDSLLGIGNISLLIVYFLCVLIVAYMSKSENNKMQWISWISLAAWYTLFIFYGANTYWYILMAPFMILILLNNNKHFRLGLVVELVLTNVMLLERVIRQGRVFGGRHTFSGLYMKWWSNTDEHILNGMVDRILRYRADDLHVVFTSMVVVLSFWLLFLFYPKNREPVNCDEHTKEINWAIWGHVVVLALWTLLLVIGNWYLSR